MGIRKIELPFRLKKPVLALGGQTKNTLCFASGKTAFLSAVHPDLDNPKDFSVFERELKSFLKKRPRVIACDLHPEYRSSRLAKELQALGYKLSAVQHHHAHIASCMAENGLANQRVIGVAFDGTGLGADNRIWGAEFLICNYKNFTRAAHLREIPLLGSEMAIREPFRLSAAWLYLIYKDKFLGLGIDFTRGINRYKWRVLKNMYLSGFNAPLASSMGRLFDAASSLALNKHKAGFEAQLAIELEKSAARYTLGATGYKFGILRNKEKYIVDPVPVFKEMVGDIKRREPKGKIAYRFHLAVAGMIVRSCLILRRKTGINKVVLSGGVFQNMLLQGLVLDLLYIGGFKVIYHRMLSSNDSGLSFGEAVIAGLKG